jgi:hypothetical protein
MDGGGTENWAAADRPILRGRRRRYLYLGGWRREAATVTTDLLGRARAGDGEAFRELVDPYRRELQVHCHRILGSLQDAEDASRTRCCRPGRVWPGSRGGRRCGPGCTRSPPAGAWTSCGQPDDGRR